MWALPVPQEALDPGAPHAAVWRKAGELALPGPNHGTVILRSSVTDLAPS